MRNQIALVGPQPIETQVSSILTSSYSLENVVVESWNRFVEIAKGIVHPPLYLASKCAFLALNLTGINAIFNMANS
tara:strand:+ start:761 stop:988 length:228 start_codon:yes stop_codon:yes gene_type:complete